MKGGPAQNGNRALAQAGAPLRAALELAALGAGLTLTVSLMAALPSWYLARRGLVRSRLAASLQRLLR